MYKLIVNAPGGKQELIEVSEGGGYFDESLVVWDERKDGPLSATDAARVGGLVKGPDGALSVDAQRKKQTDDVLKAEKDADEKQKADRAARKTIIKDLKKAKTIDELKAVIEALAKEFGAEVE